MLLSGRRIATYLVGLACLVVGRVYNYPECVLLGMTLIGWGTPHPSDALESKSTKPVELPAKTGEE